MAWEKRYYKGTQKVYVQTDDQGQLMLESGLVPTRFSPQEDARIYNVSPHHISAERGVMITAHDATTPKPPKPANAVAADEHCWKQPDGQPYVSVEVPEVLADYPEPFPEDYIEIFTDGACQGNPGPCGWGVVIRYKGRYKELYQYLGIGTNNIAELMAISAALDALKRFDIHIKLHTDSSYSIGVLTQGWKAKANKELIAHIKQQLAPFDKVEFVKVKGHSGHPLNDRVDALAVESIASWRGASEQVAE